MNSRDTSEQHSEKGETRDLREANENIRKAQNEDTTGPPVDPKKTGNKPRFDRDR